MPTSLTRPAKKASASRAKKTPVVSREPMSNPSVPNVCRSCHSLPAGSMELMALMLVLVFSLSAVLFTSVYALNLERAQNASAAAVAGVVEE